jgi:hypothetical protein
MFYEVDEAVRRKAKTPHEISMFNLMFFNLLMGAGTVVMALIGVEFMQRIGNWGFVLPLTASLLVIAFIHVRATRAPEHAPWFVAVHWQLAMRRSRLLLIGYAITITIIGGALLLASGADRNMQDIIVTIASRIGAVPTLLLVMVSFVLESGSIYQAGRGEVPDGMVKRFPPPADLQQKDQLTTA